MVEVQIYSKDYCPYCKKAKMLLDTLDLKYVEHNVEEEGEFEKLKEKTGHMTVPQIFIGENFIGGASELENLIRSGDINTYINEN